MSQSERLPMPIRFLILACAIFIGIGIASADYNFPTKIKTQYRQKIVKVPVERGKIVEKRIPITKPDGYMTENDCGQLPNGEDFRDVLWRWGWPALDDAQDSYA